MNIPGMLEASRQYISERILPLMYMTDDHTAFVRGTAFLLKDEDDLFLVTARHVLEEDDGIKYGQIAFPIFGPEKPMYSLPHAPYLSTKESGADLAVVPLTYPKDVIDALYWKTFGVDSFYAHTSIGRNQTIIVHGFPASLQESTTGDKLVKIGVIDFTTSIYTGDYSGIMDYRPEIDIVFAYKDQITVDGKLQEVPDLRGISGAALFCNENLDKGIWSPDKCLKIVGLEKAIKKGVYIRATRSTSLIPSLKKLLAKTRNL